VWFSLLIRKALLLVAIVFAPIALSGSSWDATKGWFPKWAAFVLALIFSKLVLVVVFLVAITQVSQPIDFDLASISDPIAGIVLMFVAAFAPYMTYKFISFVGFDMYHAMSAEQEAKSAMNRPLPTPVSPGGDAPKKVLDAKSDGGDSPSSGVGGGGGGGPTPPSTSGGATPAAAGSGGAASAGASGAGSGAGAAGAGAAAGPVGIAAVAGAKVAGAAATAGPKAGAAIGGAADQHASAAGETQPSQNTPPAPPPTPTPTQAPASSPSPSQSAPPAQSAQSAPVTSPAQSASPAQAAPAQRPQAESAPAPQPPARQDAAPVPPVPTKPKE